MDAKKALRKHNLFRTLKVVAYCLGYPLLLLLFLQSSYYLGFGVKADTTKLFIILWAVVTAVQIIVTLITKSYSVRAISVILVTVILMTALSFLVDMKAKDHLDEMAISFTKDYYRLDEETEVKISEGTVKDGTEGELLATFTVDGEEQTVSTPIASYNEHLAEFKPWSGGTGMTGSIGSLQSRLISTYNIKSSGGGSGNTDGTKSGKALEKDDGTLEYWFSEKGNVYKKNGLYSDSYVFGVDQTVDILLTISRTQSDFKKEGKDAETELKKALIKAENSTEWKNYKKTEEYQNAYGKGGTASNYMLTEEKINKLLSALGNGIVEDEYLGGKIKVLLNLVGDSLGGISIDTFKGLTVDGACALIDSFGLTDTILGLVDVKSLTADDYLGDSYDITTPKGCLMKLASSFSYYQCSEVLPKMYFIEDETIRTYAYARYYAEIHGANVGSVLYSSKSDGTIGKITMSDSGVSKSNAFSEKDLCTIRVYKQYNCQLLTSKSYYLFQLLLVRRYALFFAGFTALSFIFAYFFAFKQFMYSVILKNGCVAGKKGGRA